MPQQHLQVTHTSSLTVLFFLAATFTKAEEMSGFKVTPWFLSVPACPRLGGFQLLADFQGAGNTGALKSGNFDTAAAASTRS